MYVYKVNLYREVIMYTKKTTKKILKVKDKDAFYNLKDILLDFRIGDDFENKRSGSQLKSNYKARYLNFTWNSPIRCILSLVIAGIYIITPKSLVKKFYQIENT